MGRQRLESTVCSSNLCSVVCTGVLFNIIDGFGVFYVSSLLHECVMLPYETQKFSVTKYF